MLQRIATDGWSFKIAFEVNTEFRMSPKRSLNFQMVPFLD